MVRVIVVIALIIIVGLTCLYFTHDFKNGIQTLGVILVGGFFLYRFFAGWMSANVDLAIESSRVHLNEAEDYLAVIVKLGRGEYGTLKLGDAMLRITCLDSNRQENLLALIGTKRIDHDEGKLIWKKELEKDPLNLHAKETSEFAAGLPIPRKAACSIELTLLTHRAGDGFEWIAKRRWGQRRSSSISLPLSDA